MKSPFNFVRLIKVYEVFRNDINGVRLTRKVKCDNLTVYGYGGIKMGFTQKIFQRATIRGITDYLLFGHGPDADARSYEERLDESYLKFEKVVFEYDTDIHSNLLSVANDMTCETATVYTEIGLQAGILLMRELIQNVGIDNQGNKVDYKEKYDALFQKVLIAFEFLEHSEDENVKKARDILKSEQCMGQNGFEEVDEDTIGDKE